MDIKVTGECLVPGKSPAKTEAEHFARYEYAANFVKHKKVLDIACGVGFGCGIYAESGAESIVGVDISISNIQYARSMYPSETITFLQKDLFDIDYQDEFDIVTSFETIEHVKDDKLALKKLRAALRNNGILIMSTPNRKITSPSCKTIDDKPENEFHYREYTLREFRDLVSSSGFKIKAILGQRNRMYFPLKTLNRVLEKLCHPDTKGNIRLRKNYFSEARYYTLVLEKTEHIG
jgi:cyclopropane fatty-acyl-phospholipid synthase-like methyltransferase